MELRTNRCPDITRRGFLKTSGITAATVGLALGSSGTLSALADTQGTAVKPGEEKIFSVQCRANCAGACRLWAHVRDEKLVKLEPAEYPNDMYRGGCLRGYSYMYRMYSNNRIKQPMRRVGERGAGEWEAISWDEAIKECSERLQAIIDKYTARAIGIDISSGSWASINGGLGIINRFGGALGCTQIQNSYDQNGISGMTRLFNISDFSFCNDISSVMDSTLFVSWGTNPCLTALQNWRWVTMAHERGTKLLCIDVMRSISSHKFDETVIVKPGQDGYLALAMCNYILCNDMQDKAFIAEKTTASLLVRKDTARHLRKSNWPADSAAAYALQMEDYYAACAENPMAAAFGMIPLPPDAFYVWDNAIGAPALADEAIDPAVEGAFVTEGGVEITTAYTLLKEHLKQYTISEAERICGLPAEKIEALARTFATEHAVSVNITFGTDHYLNGHLTAWAIGMLMTLCGHVAKPGNGIVGVFMNGAWDGVYETAMMNFWTGSPDFKGIYTDIVNLQIPEVLATGKHNGKDYALKAIISNSSNFLSNGPNQKYMIEKGLPNLDFWVVMDMEWTDSARYADIVLPIASWYEVEDLRVSYNNPYMVLSQQAVKPLHDTKSDLDAITMLGRAMGFEASFPGEGKEATDAALALLFSNEASINRGYSADQMRKDLVVNYTGRPEGEAWIRGLNGWPTDSGRIQLYWENPTPHFNYGQDLSDSIEGEHLVYYRPPKEADEDSDLAKKYPYVFIQEHARFRTHSQFFDTEILRELDPEPLGKVNPVSAREKGVKTGDYIEVFNDRGHAVVKCLEDEGIAPGIVNLAKGWQRHQYKAGCYSELTNGEMDPYGGAVAPYDTRVDFRKWEEQ